jgi:microcompartment protein CcmK/EutM
MSIPIWTAVNKLAQHAEELAARVEQQQPAPSTPAGKGELVRCVANAAARARCDGPYEPEQAAILAVADWLDRMGREFSAALLRDEVGR